MMKIKSIHFDDYDASWHNPEAHVQFHILVFVVQGKVQYRLNGTKLELEKSDFLLIPSGTVREARSHPDGRHQKYTALFVPGEAEHEELPLTKLQSYRIVRSHHFEYVKQRFATLHQHWAGRQIYFETLAKSICTELLALFHREVSMHHISPMKLRLAAQMKEYIIEHYRKPIRMDELARQIRRSANYAISIFKETTGQTPVEFMLHMRISTARDLLQNTDMTQAEIAEYLGFYDASYFYRTFKRLTGSTPATVRQSANR